MVAAGRIQIGATGRSIAGHTRVAGVTNALPGGVVGVGGPGRVGTSTPTVAFRFGGDGAFQSIASIAVVGGSTGAFAVVRIANAVGTTAFLVADPDRALSVLADGARVPKRTSATQIRPTCPMTTANLFIAVFRAIGGDVTNQIGGVAFQLALERGGGIDQAPVGGARDGHVFCRLAVVKFNGVRLQIRGTSDFVAGLMVGTTHSLKLIGAGKTKTIFIQHVRVFPVGRAQGPVSSTASVAGRVGVRFVDRAVIHVALTAPNFCVTKVLVIGRCDAATVRGRVAITTATKVKTGTTFLTTTVALEFPVTKVFVVPSNPTGLFDKIASLLVPPSQMSRRTVIGFVPPRIFKKPQSNRTEQHG